jgi:hypothetical protein
MKAQKLRGREKIISARIASIFVLVTLLLSAPLAQAVPITIEITGEVTNGDGSLWGGNIYYGTPFTGTYTYDSSAPDSSASSNFGWYVFDSPYGINISLGGIEFKTTPSHIGQFEIKISDNGPNLDYYTVWSNQNTPLSDGTTISWISWGVYGPNEMLSSTDLPITAPVIDQWDNRLFIHGRDIYGNGYNIYGTVSQAVPEPLTGVLMLIGVFFFRRRKKAVKAQKLRGRQGIVSAPIATLLVFATILLSAPLVHALPITIEITGNVTSVGGYTEAIPDTIYEGVAFAGTYTYESSTVDSGDGHYVHDAPYGIILSLGGYEFKTAPGHVGQFDMRIADDLEGNGVWDYYLVRSYENVADPSVDFIIDSIEWNLWDSTHTALSSGDLPATVPVLTDWDHNVFKIHGLYGPNLSGLSIYGTVTQAVPEPSSVVLMLIGVLFFRRRRTTMKAQKPRGREGYLSVRFVTFLVFATLLLSAPLAQAVPISIEITGEVTSASGSGLPGSIYEGVTFTGTYTYDSSTSDSYDNSQWGKYEHDYPYGISIVMGGYEFKTAPDHVGQFKIQIGNDVSGNGVWDEYWVQSQYENISFPSLGFNIGSICWYLSDSTHLVFSSDALPTAVPVLTDWDHNVLTIYGSGDLGLSIEGTVTQAVPEPLTGVLMLIGVLFFRYRR